MATYMSADTIGKNYEAAEKILNNQIEQAKKQFEYSVSQLKKERDGALNESYIGRRISERDLAAMVQDYRALLPVPPSGAPLRGIGRLPENQTIELIPYFQLTYMRNQGAAFSFLSGAGGWQRWFFIGLAIVASVFIFVWLRKLDPSRRREAVAWALVLGGALGNLIDRILYGYVIDFLDVYVGDWHWPAFNVADSAITVGVALLLLDSFKAPPVAGTAR